MRAQLAVAKRQARSGEISAAAALDVIKESARARIDQIAPRVVAFYERPEGPLVDTQRSGMPNANDLRLFDSESFERSSSIIREDFAFPQDTSTFIWFHGKGLLVNEGSSSALVRVYGEAEFIEGVNPLDGSHLTLPYFVGDGVATEAILPPGGAALFRWASGHTVKEWADARDNPAPPRPGGAIWLTIAVFDTQHASVIDTLESVFQPTPIYQDSNREGVYVLNELDSNDAVYVQPTTRGYVIEGAATDDRRNERAYYREFEEGHADDKN
ncbi:hypothetical protein [Brevibacterium casei]|uniref:hypothetical protein n=1 Tax=Brevibacterium casei TaxID=33889 RepID=UPI0016438C15|nr:hypothetical protein [Brevibacterium casei]